MPSDLCSFNLTVARRFAASKILSSFMPVSEVFNSPNGLYSVEMHDDFSEISMGSPVYGTLTLKGARGNLPEGRYGETILFSPDSRFVALEKLTHARPYQTQLIVVEFPRGLIITAAAPSEGRVTPVNWLSPKTLVYSSWRLGYGKSLIEWNAPVP